MTLAACALIALYVVKSLAGIDLVEGLSLGSWLPIDGIEFNAPLRPQAGELILDEDFEPRFALARRWDTHVRSKLGRATLDYPENCMHASRCARIRAPDTGWWSLGARTLVVVQPGEFFEVEALVANDSDRGKVEIQVACYDSAHALIDRARWKVAPSRRFAPERIAMRLQVPANVAAVRLRLAGSGPGEFRLDDIRFRSCGASIESCATHGAARMRRLVTGS